MRKLTLTTAIATLFIAAPLTGAYAEKAEDSARDGYPYVDEQSTQSISPEQSGNIDRLETALTAAETNLEASERTNSLTPADVIDYRAQIDTIRQSAMEEVETDGQLSAESYDLYQAQLETVQRAMEDGRSG